MEIICNKEKQLGRGQYGVVYEGTFRGERVAVKRVQLIDKEKTKREDELKSLNHPNLIKLLHSEENTDFKYYALEFCVATLDQVYLNEKHKKKYNGPLPSVEDILLQLAGGLEYIHENRIVHRDLKPENVLIWVADSAIENNRQVLMKWADFGLCKRTEESGSFSMSGVRGNFKWIAPEISKVIDEIHDRSDPTLSFPRGTIQSDVFAEGLVFAYILLEGKHPYGTESTITANLSKNSAVNLNEIPDEWQTLKNEVIVKMLETNPGDRLTAGQVTQNLEQLIRNDLRITETIRKDCISIGKRNGIEFYSIPLTKTSNSKPAFECYCFGKQNNINIQHKTILLLGESGSGKTTWINAIINYIFGVEWDDPFRFHLIEEQLVGQSQANSQTSIITAYDIYHMDGFRIPYSLTIVDTPGYGDTKGLDRDKEITEMVRKFFEDKNGIQQLDVVGFVAQASLPRLTTEQIYIFDSVFSIFGNDVKENINFLLTFAASLEPPVLTVIKEAHLPCPTNSDGDPLHHKFNNSGFFCPSRPEASSNSSHDEFNRFSWKMGMDNFQKFFSSLATMKAKSLSLTKQVLDERKKLEATVDGLQPLIKIGLSKMEELRKTNQVISNSQAQIVAKIDVKVELPVNQYSTNCNICYVVCHYPCSGLDEKDIVNCLAMDLSMPEATRTCRICPQKCIWNLHVRQPYTWEYVKETQMNYPDAIEQKYESEQKKMALEKEIDNNRRAVLGLVNIVINRMKRLDGIALRPNPFSTPQYIDLIIDAEEQEKKVGFEERTKSLKKLREKAVIFNKVRDNESLFEL